MSNPTRILIVDAEAFFRDAIREALAGDGFDCVCVESGAEALEAIEEPGVGVAVLDLQIPGTDGLELLGRLRESRPLVRAIVLATHADQPRVLEALRLGACDYLAKPLHDEELLLAVRRAAEGHELAVGAQRLRLRLSTLESRLAALAGLARQAGETDGLSALRAGVVDAVADVLGASKASVMLVDDAGTQLRVAAATGRKLAIEEFDPVPVGQGPAGRAFRESILVRSDDGPGDELGPRPPGRYQTRAFAIAPLQSAAGPLGVLCATDPSGGAFDDVDAALLRILALQAGLFLSVVPSSEAPVEGADTALDAAGVPPEAVAPGDPDAELARSVCDAVTAEVEPSRLIEAALRPVARALDAAPVSLFLQHADGDLVREGQCDGAVRPDRTRLPRGRGLTGTVFETGRLVASGEPAADARFEPGIDTPEDGRPGPFLCLPLRFRGKVLGVFRAFPPPGAEVSPRTGEVLSAALSAAVRNVLLYRSLVDTIEEVARVRREAQTR